MPLEGLNISLPEVAASYSHVKQVFPNAFNFFANTAVPVQSRTPLLQRPNLASARRTRKTTLEFGEDIPTNRISYDQFTGKVESYGDGHEYQPVDAFELQQFTGGTSLTNAINLVSEHTTIDIMKGWADVFMNQASYDSGNKTDPTNWTVSTTDLVQQVTAKRQTIFLKTGVYPDTIVVSPDVHEVIMYNVQVQALLNGLGIISGNEADANRIMNSTEAYARVFRVQRYIILDVSYNAGAPRQSAVNTQLTSNTLLLAFMGNPSMDNGLVTVNGLGASVYMDITRQMPASSNILANGIGPNKPYPIMVRDEYDPQKAGGGLHMVFAEGLFDHILCQQDYGHLFFGCIS